MKRIFVSIFVFLSLLASPSFARKSAEAEALQQKMKMMAIAGKKQMAAEQTYASALQAYNAHRANIAAGAESQLYREYHDLVVAYTLAMTNFWLRQDNDKNLPLPVLGPAAGPVTLTKVKNDYDVAIQEYIVGLNIYDQNLAFNLPTDPPPFPPVGRGDKDYANYVQTEKVASSLRQMTIGKLIARRNKIIASMPIYPTRSTGSTQPSAEDRPGFAGCPPGQVPYSGLNLGSCGPY